jgi:hypothetical protein
MNSLRRLCFKAKPSLSFFAAIVCILALAGVCAYGQNTNAGEIRGTVTDPSGAVVPSAKVTIANIQTGITTALLTNSSGIYDALSLLPGDYTITVAAQGFSTMVRRGINLEAQVITVDARLAVGSTSSEVLVSAESPMLQTEGAQTGNTLPSETMRELPHVGQSWLNFTNTLPGVTGSGAGVSVNGTEKYEGNWLSDGGNIVLPRSNNLDAVDTLETVAEVQVTTSSFNAQYGSGTAVFSQITKSGTNRFHGAAYDYTQNDAFNARSFFSQQVPHQRRDQFGGSIGGPIRKDKFFFYYNFDTTINRSGTQGFSTYPTVAMRNGDFSDPAFRTIYDPTSLLNGVRTPYPGNKIPQGSLDSVALKAQAFFPTPNLAGFANNYYFSGVNQSFPFTQFIKFDYNLSSSNRLSFSGSWRRQITTPDQFASPTYPITTNSSNSQGFQGQITDVWIISPTVVNEFRASAIRQYIKNVPQALNQGYISKLGLQYALADLYPSISISGPVGGTSIGPGNSATLGGNTYTPSDTITITHGKHIIKAGGQYEANQDNGGNWGDINAASFSFSGAFTGRAPFDGKSGLGYADFLTGQVASWSASLSPVVGVRMKDASFFVQDDIKLRPNLTVNLGLRYEIQGGWSEVENRMAIFDPTLTNPVTNTPGAMWYAGNNGRNALQATIYNTVLPRIGFAWSPGKFSVRGGFGMYTHRWGTDVYAAPAVRNTTGFFTTGSLSDTTQVSPVFLLSNPAPPLNTYYPNAAARTPGSLNGQPVGYFPYHTPAAKLYDWSFTVQRELTQGMVAEASYVGNHGANLSFTRDINQLPQSRLGQGQTARPYPQYQGIGADMFDGIENYDALQLSLRKRFSKGLSLDANYTFSKNLVYFDAAGWAGQAGGIYQNSYCVQCNYGISNNDVPQAFKTSVVYQLPIGHGRSLLGSSKGVLDAFLGGWQASGIFIKQNGYPFTPTMGTGSSGALAGSWFPNRMGSGKLDNPTIAHWFDTSAFVQPTALTFGNSGRNILRGPNQTTMDFSMGKNFNLGKLREGSQLQFRMDATNILNHPVFNNPNASIGNAAVGTITSTAVGGRVIQLGARLSF